MRKRISFFLISVSTVLFFLYFGRIAQLGERSPYKAEVTGSIPVPPTIKKVKSEESEVRSQLLRD